MNAGPLTTPSAPAPSAAAENGWSGGWRVAVLGSALVLAVYVAGSAGLDAPWIQGDEFIFIINNPDVNPGGSPAALVSRLGRICTKIHDDLYQPIPILTYALEWELTRGSTVSFRRTDLLLHAANAVLLWWVLAMVLARGPWGRAVPVPVVAWALALLWALHPVLVTTYAADMGRTHLLSATFALVALALYVRAATRGQTHYFVAAMAALVLAMLCKPIPGWLLLALVLEAARFGWRRVVLSPRLYVVALICITFAGLTMWTSAQSGLPEDASKGLFGDPVARSALAVWIYFRNLVAPFWLAVWYLPDPATNWANPLVWIGLTLALASVFHAVRSWRRVETRRITFGWAWCWGMLLPVVGLVGAREAAAVDRYLYQPLMGIMLVLGVVVARGLAELRLAAPARYVLPVAGVVGLVMVVADRPQCEVARSTLRRASRVVRLNPGDPRALEGLAAAYDFARNHRLPSADLPELPPETNQLLHFNELFRKTLTQAATADNLEHYFPGPEDRGPFHRRLSYRFLMSDSPEQAAEQAEQARLLLPDEFLTFKRLAHAYQALERFPEAVEAYKRCEELLPETPLTRAVHFTDFGYLLMFDLDRGAEACWRFEAAFETGHAPLPAKVGLALCQIRYGQGAAGFKLISEVLNDPRTHANPRLAVQAGLVLGEYHLLSHHWDQATAVYDVLIRDDPTHYAALRGFHEVCLQTGRYDDAVMAWHDALQCAPGRREFRSFLVWTLSLAGDESAPATAEELLASDPDNPLACFALMLEAIRAGDLGEAVSWVQRARAGTAIPKARAFERAAASVRLMIAREELAPEAVVAEAALYAHGDFPSPVRSKAVALLDDFVAGSADSRWKELAQGLRGELSDVEAAP